MTRQGEGERTDAPEANGSATNAVVAGIYFYGVTRVRAWPRRAGSGDDDGARIRYRDIEALVRTVPYELPPFDEAHVLAHQRTVERAMRRGTVLPAPYGIIFRGRRELIGMLQDQYLAIDEGLSFLEGHWEMRLHISATSAGDAVALTGMAARIYSELRRHARAAVPFAHEGERLLSAAFLVERGAWLDFVERCEAFGATQPELDVDVTGPWPAYDFVRISD
jgi:hypothetical protein